jgi:acyl transferase domain-containing protein
MGSYALSNPDIVVKSEIMPIAVVGIGFRGPGDATDVEKFWKMICEAREARTLVPKEKWNNEAFYHPDSNRNGTVRDNSQIPEFHMTK